MTWRPIVLCLTGLLWCAVALGRYESGSTGFLLVAPILIAVFSLSAALLWWTNPKPRT